MSTHLPSWFNHRLVLTSPKTAVFYKCIYFQLLLQLFLLHLYVCTICLLLLHLYICTICLLLLHLYSISTIHLLIQGFFHIQLYIYVQFISLFTSVFSFTILIIILSLCFSFSGFIYLLLNNIS
jgi:hypothetical protein